MKVQNIVSIDLIGSMNVEHVCIFVLKVIEVFRNHSSAFMKKRTINNKEEKSITSITYVESGYKIDSMWV